MVSFGDWITEPDWTRFDTYSAEDGEPLANSTGFVEILVEGDWVHIDDGAPVPITMVDITKTLRAAMAQARFRYGLVRFGWKYQLSFPFWRSSWSAAVMDQYFKVGVPEGGFFFTEGVADPEDAVGVQYEGFPWDPEDPWSTDADTRLGAESVVKVEFVGGGPVVSTHMAHDGWIDEKNVDRLLTGGFSTDIVAVSDQSANRITSIEVAPTTFLPSPFSLELLGTPDVDITALLNADYTGEIRCQTNTLVQPYRKPDEMPVENNNLRYGVRLHRLVLRWTIRALPYRWVYDTDPHRRIYPRDDGLAGGARRTYPPSKATQTGNRTTGGYL